MTDPALPIATDFIARHEGFRSAPYRDQGGVWTIGYGFTITADGKPVSADTPTTTQEAAQDRLQGLVARVLNMVRGMVAPHVSDHAAAALTSFAFNVGTNALRTSTLLRLLNQGETDEAARQFAAWVYCAGRIDPGLVNRRRDEAVLFLTPDSETETTQISADDLNRNELKRIGA